MTRIGHVQQREWRWVLLFSIVVMALTTVPYLIGWAAAGEAWYFSGFVFGVEDGNSYIAKMLRGAHGAWLFKLSYTVEPHPPALMFPFHILLGKITGALVGADDPLRLHSALVFSYHLARVVSGIALLAASYRFLAEFLRTVRLRRIGLALVALGGGLGWLLTLVRAPGLPLDFYSPEAFTFLNLYGLPHLAAARALLLAGLACYWTALRAGRLRWAWAAALLWLGVAFIQPFYVALVYLLLVLHFFLLLLLSFRQVEGVWQPPERDAGTLAMRALYSAPIAGLPAFPLVVYTAFLFQLEPVYRQWSSQNLILSPAPGHYLAAWGLLLAPGLFGLRTLYRRNLTAWAWVVVWALALPVLLYAPYNLQRRTSEAIQLPLVGLALLGLAVGIAPRVGLHVGRLLRRWGPAVLLGLLLPTTVLLLMGGALTVSRPSEPAFLPRAQVEMYACLAQRLPPGEPVLSSYEVGNALPAYAPLVAYIGHGPETFFLEDKRDRVNYFYNAGTLPANRLNHWFWLQSPYFVYSPHEAELSGGVDFTAADYAAVLQPFCGGDEYVVYSMRQ